MSEDEELAPTAEQVNEALTGIVKRGVSIQTDPIYARVALQYLVELADGSVEELNDRYHRVIMDTVRQVESQMNMAEILRGVNGVNHQ